MVPVPPRAAGAAHDGPAAGKEPFIAPDQPLMQPPSTSLCSLPEDALAHVLSLLHHSDVLRCAATSRRLRDTVLSDSLWYQLCFLRWSDRTSVKRWLAQSEAPDGSSPSGRNRTGEERSPRTYRQLYALLLEYEQLVGLWRPLGVGPGGALYRFAWARDGIQGEELLFASPPACLPPELAPFVALTPGVDAPCGSRVVADVIDGANCVLREFVGRRGSREPRSPHAEAAAAVAISALSLGGYESGSGGAAEAMLGSSPQGSFEYEISAFMQAQVAGGRRSRKGKKGLARSPSSPGLWQHVPVLHHLRRVDVPRPNKRHRLAGLWACEPRGARGGVQVLSIAYDFSGRSARIVATKVTGDTDVPAGQVYWSAAAAPLPAPLPQEELDLIQARRTFLPGGPRGGGSNEDLLAALFEEEEEGGSGEEGGGGAADGHKQVVGCFRGHGAVIGAGPGTQPEAEGRLWAYADGSIGFLWMDDEVLIDMARIPQEHLQ